MKQVIGIEIPDGKKLSGKMEGFYLKYSMVELITIGNE